MVKKKRIKKKGATHDDYDYDFQDEKGDGGKQLLGIAQGSKKKYIGKKI